MIHGTRAPPRNTATHHPGQSSCTLAPLEHSTAIFVRIFPSIVRHTCTPVKYLSQGGRRQVAGRPSSQEAVVDPRKLGSWQWP